MLVTNGKLDMQQHKIDTFYTASECERFKAVVEKKILLSLNTNTTNAVALLECRREI
jgi:hypothetical protein